MCSKGICFLHARKIDKKEIRTAAWQRLLRWFSSGRLWNILSVNFRRTTSACGRLLSVSITRGLAGWAPCRRWAWVRTDMQYELRELQQHWEYAVFASRSGSTYYECGFFVMNWQRLFSLELSGHLRWANQPLLPPLSVSLAYAIYNLWLGTGLKFDGKRWEVITIGGWSRGLRLCSSQGLAHYLPRE